MFRDFSTRAQCGKDEERKFKECLNTMLPAEDTEDIRVARDHATRAASELERIMKRLPSLFNKYGCDRELPDISRGWKFSSVILGLDDVFVAIKELQWLLEKEYTERDNLVKDQKRGGRKPRHGNRRRPVVNPNPVQPRPGYHNHRHCGYDQRQATQFVPKKKFRGLLKASFADEETT
jgi:hypothetical protein